MPYELFLMKIAVCPKLILSFIVLEQMSTVFIGVYVFDAWDISHEFMIAFMKFGGSSGNMNARKIMTEILGTFS